MLLLGVLLLLTFSVAIGKPFIHHSVGQELRSNDGTLLVTFKLGDLTVAEDPQRLLEESRKTTPFFATIDVAEFVGRDGLYQKQRGEYVYRKASEEHQKSRATLQSLGAVIVDDFVVSNSFVIKADEEIVEVLSRLESVVEIHTNHSFRAAIPDPVGPERHHQTPAFLRGLIANGFKVTAQWNIQKIGADRVWQIKSQRSKGAGLIYAVADTGVDFNHPNVALQYRGLQANNTYVHDYSWWDGVRTPVRGKVSHSRCGVASPVPCDDQGHGTHVTSIAIGADGYGVAPDARYISCRNMDSGVGSTATYLSCLRFFLAPHDLEGKNPRPDLRPHVVGNSYGCPDDEGCSKNAMTAAFATLKAAGVFMAVSAGNEGPKCSTVNAPPAVERDALVVGAVNARDQLAPFSSRGPVTVFQGITYRKPDVVAPGVEIVAAYPNGTFRSLSGTSMAGPHVGGAALLLMALCPCIERDVNAIKNLIESTAIPHLPIATQLCGNDLPDSVPNNHFGYGRIDVLRAVHKCLQKCYPSA